MLNLTLGVFLDCGLFWQFSSQFLEMGAFAIFDFVFGLYPIQGWKTQPRIKGLQNKMLLLKLKEMLLASVKIA